MTRRLFNIATILSLVAFVSAILFGVATHVFPFTSTHAVTPSIQRYTGFSAGQFRVVDTETKNTPHSHESSSRDVIEIDFWPVSVAASILPLLWALGMRPAFNKAWLGRHWICQKCGYDLRGSPQQCPECGTPAVNPWHQNRNRPV